MLEVLRSRQQILERRDGAVYRTKFLDNAWVPMNSPEGMMHTVGDISWGTPVCDEDAQTIRRVDKPER